MDYGIQVSRDRTVEVSHLEIKRRFQSFSFNGLTPTTMSFLDPLFGTGFI